MGMLRIMSHRGDEKVTWDIKKAELGDPEAEAAVKEAGRIFNEERKKGATAFLVKDGKQTKKLDQFDQSAEQIVIVPRVVGG